MAGLAADGRSRRCTADRPRRLQERAPGAGGVCDTARPNQAPPGACATDILGHLQHHLRLQRPQELRMVVCEVSLDRVEELRVGITSELRPALALGDPALAFVDRCHIGHPCPCVRATSLRPADVLLVTPIHGEHDAGCPLAIRFQNVAGGRESRVRARGSSFAGACPSRSAASSSRTGLRGRQVRLLLAYLLLNRVPPCRARGADRRAVARPRAGLAGCGAAHAALAAALGARRLARWRAATS